MSSSRISKKTYTETIRMEIGSSEPWPNEVRLYQPYEDVQILLADNSSVLSVQTFLRMCDLEYTVVMMSNAAEMSPSGKVPFIKAGKFVIAEISPIIAHANSKGISLCKHLDMDQKADMKAYMTLVENVLGNAENFITWADELNFNEVTKLRYGCAHPWPLNTILTWLKRREVLKKLKVYGYGNKTIQDVYEEVDSCCKSLSSRLGDGLFFFGDNPTELDAIVFWTPFHYCYD
ncbi:MTX [Lepeophtheirus salmonis]|uniref:MTX n=1 Tax=Lepeophtheirus salmonis TaxID=72036 RepID=A0A7R8CYN7_LEPSM|nr:MTX [Lepeophtheirus salmonis]CAF2970480.1 MTX [Lepeophtheirus salmonis]